MAEDRFDIDERTKNLLCQLVDHFDKEDRFVRERQIRLWKKLKYYWSGYQRLWWSEVAHDWRIIDVLGANDVNQSGDQSFYDKPINIFRAYLESIIAAMSITIPTIKCFPDDADNSLDLETAKAGDKIADLIGKHNDIMLEWLHALFIWCTEGMVAAYTYTKEDYAYGSYTSPKYEDQEEEQSNPFCPNCGNQLDPDLIRQELDEFDPNGDDVELHDLLADTHTICPECMAQIDPEFRTEKVIVTRLTGITTKPKSRQILEVKGGLYVKVPNYAMDQAGCPYLIYAYETHYSNAIEQYPHLRDKFTGQSKIGPGSGGMYDPYERWGRLSTQYFGEYPTNTTTIRNCWFRTSSFNILNDEEDVKYLKKKFPDGVRCVKVNDEFAEAENECLDDHWTLTKNPLADFIHFDPTGLLLTSIQEITNDLVSLVIQTVEHGIPQTFADPAVLDFEAYRQSEVSPGAIYPTKTASGKSIAEAFYEVKTASLSGEVLPFAEKIQEAGQLVSGALPSLFGGAQPNSSKTAAQYSMSRAQAQQRLQTPWKMLNIWWKNIHGKMIPAYIKTVMDDEHFVDQDKSGDFVNVYIRKAELQGKIGSVELESSELLPSTWGQQRDVIMQLMQAANPEVMQALTSPENIPLVARAIGLDEFDIPGSDDREKQYEEIKLLLASAPMPSVDQMGQPSQSPAVDIDPLVDNHQIEADVCRRWAVSTAGRLAKQENPQGYTNVLLHMKRHMDMLAVASGQAMGQPPQNQGPPPEPKPMAAPLPQQGPPNAPTIQ